MTATIADRPDNVEEAPVCTMLLESGRKKNKKPCGELMVRVGSWWMCRKCDQLEDQDNF